MDEPADLLERVAGYSLLTNREGPILTVELLRHGMHVMAGKRSGKCLACYRTISRN